MAPLGLHLNAFVATASTLVSLLALSSPSLLAHTSPSTPSERFFTRLYAARAVPFGVLAGALPYFERGPATGWVLLAAAAVQVLDGAIAVGREDWVVLPGVTAAVLVHGGAGWGMLGL